MIRYQVRKKKRKTVKIQKMCRSIICASSRAPGGALCVREAVKSKGGDQPGLREVNVMEQQMDETLDTWSKKTQMIL